MKHFSIARYLISVVEAIVFIMSWIAIYFLLIPDIHWSFIAVFVVFALITASDMFEISISGEEEE